MSDRVYTPNPHATSAPNGGSLRLDPESGAATVDPEHLPTDIPVFVSKDELFFWTRLWQEGERDSAEAREAGEVVEFDSATDLMKWLLSDED